jgi:hypothetical protein
MVFYRSILSRNIRIKIFFWVFSRNFFCSSLFRRRILQNCVNYVQRLSNKSAYFLKRFFYSLHSQNVLNYFCILAYPDKGFYQRNHLKFNLFSLCAYYDSRIFFHFFAMFFLMRLFSFPATTTVVLFVVRTMVCWIIRRPSHFFSSVPILLPIKSISGPTILPIFLSIQ